MKNIKDAKKYEGKIIYKANEDRNYYVFKDLNTLVYKVRQLAIQEFTKEILDKIYERQLYYSAQYNIEMNLGDEHELSNDFAQALACYKQLEKDLKALAKKYGVKL